MSLSKAQISRYSRQLLVPEFGVAGQERLAASSALIIGAGGLGCPAALYLAAAGVGTLGIVDRDTVALGNLHRQILHTVDSLGQPKSRSAQARLSALNPDATIRAHQESLTAATATRLLAGYDIILDGSDNFPTRYLVNDACVLLGKPLVHGGVVRLRGQILAVRPRASACFRCVFPEPPEPGAIPSCQEAGVLGTIAGIIGTLMAHEALKWLSGCGEPLLDRLLVLDGIASRFREVPLRRDSGCVVCGEAPTIRELADGEPSICVAVEPQEGQWRASR
jgi:adenylyltransferase/sulfurtransferase